MAQYNFGAGVLWGIPTANASGVAVVNPTPVQFGALQEVSLDISSENKMLYGNQQYPLAVGRGKGKISGKAKAAQLNGLLVNELFFGQTTTNSIIGDVHDLTGATIPGTPFAITPTIPSSGTWTVDLGVRNANGLPMIRVASGPTTGQYSVAAGVYTFASADTGLVVFIDYQYTAASTSAITGTVLNTLMGYAPTFRCDLSLPYNGKIMTLTLYQCIASKLGLATKLDDFMVPEWDFDAFANAAGQVFTWALTDQ